MDFEEIKAASKDEQIRAWAIEEAQNGLRNMGPIANDRLIERAHQIEKYVKSGKQDNDDG